MSRSGDTFDDFYHGTEFYYGLTPSHEVTRFVSAELQQPGEPALDLGCGEGRDSIYLASHGYRVTSIDLSRVGLAKLSHYASNHNLDIRCIAANIRDYELPQNCYAIVNMTTLLDHFSLDDSVAVANKAKGATRIGGYICAEVFTTSDPGAQQEQGRPASETAGFIRHYFAPDELRELFRDFEVVHYQETVELDSSHGNPHYHGWARIICRRL